MLEWTAYTFNPFALPVGVALAAILGLGLLTLVREHGSRISALFFFMTLSISVWLFAFIWMYCAPNDRVALGWAKLAYLGVPFIPSSIYHFSIACLGLSHTHRPLVRISWLLSVWFALAMLGSDALIGGLYHYWWGPYPRYGLLSVPYLAFFFGMTCATMGEYWRAYRASAPDTLHRRRIRCLWVAFGAIYLGSVDYVAKFGVACYPFGYIPVLVFVALAARAILRYRLVDITPALAAKQILETMTDALLLIDREGVVQSANPAATRLFGGPEEAIIGATMAGLSARLSTALPLEALTRGEVIDDYEMTLPTTLPSGGVRTVSLSTSIVRDHGGQSVATVCLFRELTKRKQAEEALRRSEERYHAMVSAVVDYAIFALNPQGFIETWNRGAERIKGYASSEVIGKHFSLFYPSEDQARGLPTALLDEARCHGRAERSGWRVRKDGTRFWAHVVMTALFDAQGQLRGFSKVTRDLTERKAVEERLTQTCEDLKASHRELQAAQLQLIQTAKLESVGRLAAGVAHEVKNPLAIILAGVNYLTLLIGLPQGRAATVFDDIREAVHRADAIIKGLLDFSAPRGLRLTPERINTVAEEALRLLKHELDRAHISVIKQFDEEVPPLPLDASKMEQAFVNVFLNAIQAMPNGGTLTVRTQLMRPALVGAASASRRHGGDAHLTTEDVSRIVVDVEDTGTGIPESALQKIFDPFFTTKPTGQGTGLGLAVTKSIVALHRGTLEIGNRPEGGVRATLVLPLSKGREPDGQETDFDRG